MLVTVRPRTRTVHVSQIRFHKPARGDAAVGQRRTAILAMSFREYARESTTYNFSNISVAGLELHSRLRLNWDRLRLGMTAKQVMMARPAAVLLSATQATERRNGPAWVQAPSLKGTNVVIEQHNRETKGKSGNGAMVEDGERHLCESRSEDNQDGSRCTWRKGHWCFRVKPRQSSRPRRRITRSHRREFHGRGEDACSPRKMEAGIWVQMGRTTAAAKESH